MPSIVTKHQLLVKYETWRDRALKHLDDGNPDLARQELARMLAAIEWDPDVRMFDVKPFLDKYIRQLEDEILRYESRQSRQSGQRGQSVPNHSSLESQVRKWATASATLLRSLMTDDQPRKVVRRMLRAFKEQIRASGSDVPSDVKKLLAQVRHEYRQWRKTK